MASDVSGFDMSDSFGPQRPSFNIGYHDSNRDEPLTDLQYGHLLNHGVSRKSPASTTASIAGGRAMVPLV